MLIKINDLKWQVRFADRDDERLVSDNTKCLGITYFNELQIFLSNDMPDELCKQTIIHELTHAFIFSYGIHLYTDDEEAVCDFVGAYLSKIYDLTNKIIKNLKRRKEVKQQ